LTRDYNYQYLEVKEEENIATVVLNNPEIHNAFNEVLIKEIQDCIKSLGKDPNIGIIVLTGNGKSFCAGADLKWMRKMVDFTKEENISDSTDLANMFEVMHRCPKPIIGKINGSAIGGGVGLVAVCDIAVSSEEAKFAFSEVKLGIIPAVISPYVVPKIGLSYARELFLTGQRFDAHKAKEIGLVHYVIPEDDLDEKIAEIIKLLGSSGPQAMAESKELLRRVSYMGEEEYKNYTIEKIAELRISKEGQEGIGAFLAKRKPNWR
jgi:methylglutaconyl-CoA hydratase